MTINYDFSGVANTNPYTLADFDHIAALGGSDFQISSGSLRTTYSGSTTFDAIARYNGTAATTGTVSLDFTMLFDSASASGPIAVGLLDADGDGYMMLVNYDLIIIKEYIGGVAQIPVLGGLGIGVPFSTGATLGVDFDLDNGTATAYINGTQHGTQATGLTLTGMAAALSLSPGDSNGNGIVTLDVTGESSVASNSAPVVNDQTFSVAVSASIGTVIGTVVATDSDGTVDSYAISGTTLAINSTTGQITLAGIPVLGLVAGTPITATVTVTDNNGDTDTATVTVNVTNAVLTDTLLDAESSNAAIANETGLTIHVYDTDGGTELYSTASATTDGSGVFVVDDDAIGVIDDTVFVVIKRSNGQTACGTMTVVDGAA